MSPTLSHEELKEMLPAAALEILEPADRDLIAGHLPDCPECTTQFHEYREVAASLALGLPAQPLDPARGRALSNRLVARARGTRARAPRLHHWGGWAVAAGLAGILMVHHSVHQTVNYGWLVAGVLMFALLGVALYARTQQRRVSALEKNQSEERRKDTKA